jgi:acyl-CoA reductase-like NAD-dependent aldehyde dehydrogenase
MGPRSSSGGTQAIISPIDGRVAYEFEYLAREAAEASIAAARAAQIEWARTSLAVRVHLCQEFLKAYDRKLDVHAHEITKMMGKPIAQARGEFSGTVRERTLHMCAEAPLALADETLPEQGGLHRIIRRVPVGIVLDIAAWNYPLAVAVNVVVPAVLAGNSVLIKHSPQTALVATQFEMAFAEAGAPSGLVQSFMVSHDLVAELLDERRFGFASFTGSVAGGHAVARNVARNNFIGTTFELGGKDPALVLEDCDFEFTVENLVDGAFYNAGQSCCAIERIYVMRSLHDRFVEAYAARVSDYVLGDPLDPTTTLGPVVDAAAAERVRRHVAEALSAGARRVSSPNSFQIPDLSACYLAPEVLVDVPESSILMREETFGPAIAISAVDSVDEAIAKMNDSPYGLTASLWTTDGDRALALAQRVEAGTVFSNRCDYLDPAMPWTGVKDSGHGFSLGRIGLRQLTRIKNLHLRPRG